MKRLLALSTLVLCPTWIASCASPEGCECGGTCEGGVALQAGATGWCKACGTGYFEGQEASCKGECGADPGGPPCADCVE